VSDDQQPEFRSRSKSYIIIFLNKLKIVENTPIKSKNKNKTSIGPFRDPQASSWLSGLNPPLIGPVDGLFYTYQKKSLKIPTG